MAKTIASNSKPNAWIVNSTDKGRKSIKNGKVYLKDSEEFQIELFNFHPVVTKYVSSKKLLFCSIFIKLNRGK
jgi:hypothetical protein